MSYTALARKWRPKKFSELTGQEHVRRALVNALESGRVHHAFLFTGTRGVGKTTIARILAKCLNCETGVRAEPCGVCASCLEIDAGRFPDLIEVDAASRTKVDDTRELLDNVQYAPTRGRYKVYLVDEVHMLSAHSFNALLKTLEEPPPHVKFLLATTDPQKLPATVLSRCLQFNLKRLPAADIAARLKRILEEEGVAFDAAGLKLVAQAADGSMRDALSLLDQLIAFGGGRAGEAEARAMLPLAPDPRTGFEMTLLRMIAFRPAGEWLTSRPGAAEPAARAGGSITAAGAAGRGEGAGTTGSSGGDSWAAIVNALELSGAARQLASHCVLVGRQGPVVRLALDARNQPVRTPAQEEKLAQALSRYFGEPVRLEFQVLSAGAETPALLARRVSEQELAAARRAFDAEPGVQGLRERFGATVLPDTVRPVK